MKKRTLAQWINLCHLRSKRAGWWDDVNSLTPAVKMSLVHSEIAETDEALGLKRKDNHLPQFEEWKVELADVFIRTGDLLGYLGSYQPPPGCQREIIAYCGGDIIRQLHQVSAAATEAFRRGRLQLMCTKLHKLLWLTMQWAERADFSLITIVDAKMEYNDARADHKTENRKKTGGKAF